MNVNIEIDIEECYNRYGPMVLRRCRFLLKDEEKALDAMQDVFVNLLKNKKKLTGTYTSSLLYTIATNVCLNILKKENRREIEGGDDIINRIASYEDHENRIILEDFLDFIFKNEKYTTREIAVMHYIDKMTLSEVSKRSGLSVSGVRKRLRRLREKVKIMCEAEL